MQEEKTAILSKEESNAEQESETPKTKKELRREAKEAKRREKLSKKYCRRVKTIAPMASFMPFVMRTRNDACNYFADEFDIGNAEDYIYQKRKEGLKGFGLMHLIIAAYVRTSAEKPYINRFIQGQRIMARNELEIMLTIKRRMKLDSEDTVVKFFPKKTDTANEVFAEMTKIITEAVESDNTDFDKTAAKFAKLPRFILRGAVNLLRFLDYYGIIPRALTKVSPFHGSMFITSMGSLGIPPIHHHLYNFGNVPVFISFGIPKSVNVIENDGKITKKKLVGINVVCDERICDGYSYASVFKTMKHYIENPHLLDTPPKEVLCDIP